MADVDEARTQLKEALRVDVGGIVATRITAAIEVFVDAKIREYDRRIAEALSS